MYAVISKSSLLSNSLHTHTPSHTHVLENLSTVITTTAIDVTTCCVCVQSIFATPWTVPHHGPMSMGFFQIRILQQIAISYSRGSSQSRDCTPVSANCANNRYTDNRNGCGLDLALNELQPSGKQKMKISVLCYLEIYSRVSIGLYPHHKDSSFQRRRECLCVFLIPGSILI